MFTLASYITFVRLFLTPVVVYYISLQAWSIAAIIFLLAAVTDILDGFVARRFGQQSDLGQVLDPIADKCLIMATLYSLLSYISHVSLIFSPFSIVCFLLLKEIILLVGGTVLKLRYNFFIQPSRLSRLASLGEIILIVIIFMQQLLSNIVEPGDQRLGYAIGLELLFQVILYSTLLLSVWLLLRYMYKILKIKF